jgi:two-component system OmpR family response regulator
MPSPDNSRILVVEDEPTTRRRLVACLERGGYAVHSVASAAGAMPAISTFRPHVVLLDILLPDSSDFSLASHIARTSDCGLIITSGFDTREDRLNGLRAGADDYLTKPCDMDELLLKVHHLVERVRQVGTEPVPVPDPRTLRFGHWVYDPARAVLTDDHGQTMGLTYKERQLLEIFLRHPRQLFSRGQLIDRLQADDQDVFDRAIDTRISRLRKKIERNPRTPALLKSIYGEGYMLDADVRTIQDTAA